MLAGAVYINMRKNSGIVVVQGMTLACKIYIFTTEKSGQNQDSLFCYMHVMDSVGFGFQFWIKT